MATMTMVICDRCGEKIQDYKQHYKVKFTDRFYDVTVATQSPTYDVCLTCLKDVERFIQRGKEEVKREAV